MVQRTDVLLAVQAALLGAVPRALRAVTCGWTDGVVIRFMFDGEVDPANEKDMQAVAAQVASELSGEKVTPDIISVDYPGDLKAHGLEGWAYMRRESIAFKPLRETRV